MVLYVDEEEVWKCPNHPWKRRHSGICPVCLRERLASLCPDCAHAHPCTCRAITTSSSSSSSSSFSRFSVSGGEFEGAGIGAVGRLSNLIDNEPAFRRSRSVTVPFLGSNLNHETREDSGLGRNRGKRETFWSLFKSSSKSKRGENGGEKEERSKEEGERRMMRKSRSVAVVTSDSGAGEARSLPASKRKGWYFPSPIEAFRQSRVSKMVFQERSPLYRG